MLLNKLVQVLEQFWKKGGKFKCAENTATWKCDEGKNHEWWWLLSKSDPTRDLAIIFMRPDHPWIGCKIEKKIQPPQAPTEKFFLFEVILLLQTIVDSLFESETQINPHQLCRFVENCHKKPTLFMFNIWRGFGGLIARDDLPIW